MTYRRNQNPFYRGFTTGPQTWSSTSWADVTNVTTITDSDSNGIFRTNSTFTVNIPGKYVYLADFNFYGSSSYLSSRLRDTTNNTTLIQRTTYGSTSVTCSHVLHGVVDLLSGTDYTLQYCFKSGSSATWNASDPIDGETMRTGTISIYYLGI